MTWWTTVAGLTPLAIHDARNVSGAQLLDRVGSNHLTATATLELLAGYDYAGVKGNRDRISYASSVTLPENCTLAAFVNATSTTMILSDSVAGNWTLDLEAGRWYCNSGYWVDASNAGQYQFVVIVKTGTDSVLYANGVQIGSSKADATTPKIDKIGHPTADASDSNFEATNGISAVGIWSGSATAGEVVALEAAVRSAMGPAVDASVSISGASTTTSAGSVTATGGATVTLTGSAVSADAGSVTASGAATAAVTGASASADSGSVAATGGAAASITGAGVPTTAGGATAHGSATAPISGAATTASAGTVTVVVQRLSLDRTYVVPPDVRRVVIPPDVRRFVVAAESRTLVVGVNVTSVAETYPTVVTPDTVAPVQSPSDSPVRTLVWAQGPVGPMGPRGLRGLPAGSYPGKTLVWAQGALSEVLLYSDAAKTQLVERRVLNRTSGTLTSIAFRDSGDALTKTRTLGYSSGVLTSVAEA